MDREKGFTIVELLIVAAIIGLLAAVALPVYQQYAIRAKHSDVLLAASGCRTRVSEVILASSQSLPNGEWGCENSAPSSRYVASISVDGAGKVIVTTRDLPNKEDGAPGGLLTMAPIGADGGTPTPGNAVAFWRCGAREDGTDIASNLLPAGCRP